MEFSKSRKIGADACELQTSILDLPFCLVAVIFSRLPITMLMACKSVCKVWQAYILDPEFGSIYAKETPYVSVILFSIFFRCSLAELKPDYDPSLSPKPAKVIKDWYSDRDSRDILLGSCNGLLCFLHHFADYGNELTLWNPLTGELGLIPSPKEESNVQLEAYLFGFSQERKEYKVLRIFTRKWKPKQVYAQICNIGSDEDWRVLDSYIPLPQGTKKPSKFLDSPQICGVAFNGAILWLTNEHCDGFLVAFDIGEERTRPIPHPREMPMTKSHNFALGVLRGCLCIFQNVHPDVQLDIWTMKKYGVVDSWSKETITFSIPLPYKRYYPFVSLGNEEMLTCEDNGTLVAYNPDENRSTQVFTSVPRVFRGNTVPYVPCFLSFNNLMKGSGGELKFAKIVTQYIST